MAGCTLGAGGADRVSGTAENRTESELTVAVEPIRSDGRVDFGQEYDLRPDDAVDFSSGDPATEYMLRTDVRGGGDSKTDTWATDECRSGPYHAPRDGNRPRVRRLSSGVRSRAVPHRPTETALWRPYGCA